jgi:hypothetical protein
MEQLQKMKDNKYSTYVDGELRADVIKMDSHWGCRFYNNNEVIKTEFYRGHSEAYAEDAAENFVLGIKKI